MLALICCVLNMHMIWIDLLLWMHHLDSHLVRLKLLYLSELCFGIIFEITCNMIPILGWIFGCWFPSQENHFQSILCFGLKKTNKSHIFVFKVSRNLLNIDRHIIFKLIFKLYGISPFTSIKNIFVFSLSNAFSIHSLSSLIGFQNFWPTWCGDQVSIRP